MCSVLFMCLGALYKIPYFLPTIVSHFVVSYMLISISFESSMYEIEKWVLDARKLQDCKSEIATDTYLSLSLFISFYVILSWYSVWRRASPQSMYTYLFRYNFFSLSCFVLFFTYFEQVEFEDLLCPFRTMWLPLAVVELEIRTV